MLGDWLVVNQVLPANPTAATSWPVAGGEDGGEIDPAAPNGRAWPRSRAPAVLRMAGEDLGPPFPGARVAGEAGGPEARRGHRRRSARPVDPAAGGRAVRPHSSTFDTP